MLVITRAARPGHCVSQAFAIRGEPRRRRGAGARGSRCAALALALAGGLILNLMPCVLPVLSVKALGPGRATRAARRRAMRRHGLAYTAGVLVSFARWPARCSRCARAASRSAGASSSSRRSSSTLLAYVLFALALSLSGVLVIGGRLDRRRATALAARPGYAGSFFTGALATVAATPCTAPFMGAAVGYARDPAAGRRARWSSRRSASAWRCRILAAELVPAWRRLLPRPGAVDDAARRQLLAFPLYASVAWLVWVVSQQAGPTAWPLALAASC